MTFTEFKTKTEFASILKMSLRTFQRKLESANLKIPRGLIAPEIQKEIFEKLNEKTTNN